MVKTAVIIAVLVAVFVAAGAFAQSWPIGKRLQFTAQVFDRPVAPTPARNITDDVAGAIRWEVGGPRNVVLDKTEGKIVTGTVINEGTCSVSFTVPGMSGKRGVQVDSVVPSVGAGGVVIDPIK